jgi:hypothetical protein
MEAVAQIQEEGSLSVVQELGYTPPAVEEVQLRQHFQQAYRAITIIRRTFVQSIEVLSKLFNPCIYSQDLILSILLVTGKPLIQSVEVVNQEVLLLHRCHLERAIILKARVFRLGNMRCTETIPSSRRVCHGAKSQKRSGKEDQSQCGGGLWNKITLSLGRRNVGGGGGGAGWVACVGAPTTPGGGTGTSGSCCFCA